MNSEPSGFFTNTSLQKRYQHQSGTKKKVEGGSQFGTTDVWRVLRKIYQQEASFDERRTYRITRVALVGDGSIYNWDVVLIICRLRQVMSMALTLSAIRLTNSWMRARISSGGNDTGSAVKSLTAW